MIAVIDYDTGNVKNLMKALTYVGLESILTDDADEILSADGVILPGVGSFGPAMDELNKRDLVPVLQEVVQRKIPLLGICLGMQLLFETGYEFGQHQGLGFLPGKIVEIPAKEGLKVPEMGWNQNEVLQPASRFAGVDGKFTYFVHSFYADCPQEIVVAGVQYSTFIPSVVSQGSVVGMQFHPEKSTDAGLDLLKAYKGMVEEYVDTRN